MRYIAVTRTTACIFALVSFCSSSYAQKRWNAPPVVTRYCSGCHGIDGNAELPYFPRLAGLDPVYAEKRLTQFQETRSPSVDELYRRTVDAFAHKAPAGNVTRNERINMEGVAHAASPGTLKQAVLWYAEQRPAPGRGRNTALVQQGKQLFMNGAPNQNIPGCVNCHGQDARGKGTAPRLAGQNAEYIEAQLDKFRIGDRVHAPEMTMVTRDLSSEQERAVAAYLQSR